MEKARRGPGNERGLYNFQKYTSERLLGVFSLFRYFLYLLACFSQTGGSLTAEKVVIIKSFVRLTFWKNRFVKSHSCD